MKRLLPWFFFILGIVTAVGPAVHSYAQSGNRVSPAECDAYARNYAESYSGGMVGGAAKGAIGGGIFGAIVGDRKAAKRGALLGGAIGGTKRVVNRNRLRRQAYEDCMAGRVQW